MYIFSGSKGWSNRDKICEFEVLSAMGDSCKQEHPGKRSPQRRGF